MSLIDHTLTHPDQRYGLQAKATPLADVGVVEPADLRKLHDVPHRRELDGPRMGRVLVESEAQCEPT